MSGGEFIERSRFYLCGDIRCNPWWLCPRCAGIPREVARADQIRAAIEDPRYPRARTPRPKESDDAEG